jgi:HAD superfamily hydrolase (TIGR01509 family)
VHQLDAGLRSWIFDLDGTLTVAVHDFPAIRRMLGLPAGKGILEALAELPAEDAKPRWELLHAHEHELALAARPAAGADALLSELSARNVRLGIFTRNSLRNVETTLRAAGLRHHFHTSGFITRDNDPPKPRPEGIWRLLEQWRSTPQQAVMVGNHRHDLDAGRAAGTTTIHVDPSGVFDAGPHADLQVRSLEELIDLLPRSHASF